MKTIKIIITIILGLTLWYFSILLVWILQQYPYPEQFMIPIFVILFIFGGILSITTPFICIGVCKNIYKR